MVRGRGDMGTWTRWQWYVDTVTVARHERVYTCCDEPYPDVTFTIHMKRRSLFYIINLIFPCLLIYAVSFLGFFLPVESGEKVNLEITILLALVVFLLIVGETLPPTPDVIPVLGGWSLPLITPYAPICIYCEARYALPVNTARIYSPYGCIVSHPYTRLVHTGRMYRCLKYAHICGP